MPVSFTFDLEPDIHTNEYKGIYEGVPFLLKILSTYKIKATFFTTCDCMEKYPKIFQLLKKKGHEIALHGYRHVRFDELSMNQREYQLKKSVLCFKKYLGEVPYGFRSPQHSIDQQTLTLLEKYNFIYDSSKTPLNFFQFIFFPKKLILNFSNFFSNSRIHKIGKLTEIPTTSFFIPFVSLTLRALPRPLLTCYLRILKILNKNIVFYAHSWDFIDLKESRIARKWPKEKLLEKIKYTINFFSKDKFIKLEEAL